MVRDVRSGETHGERDARAVEGPADEVEGRALRDAGEVLEHADVRFDRGHRTDGHRGAAGHARAAVLGLVDAQTCELELWTRELGDEGIGRRAHSVQELVPVRRDADARRLWPLDEGRDVRRWRSVDVRVALAGRRGGHHAHHAPVSPGVSAIPRQKRHHASRRELRHAHGRGRAAHHGRPCVHTSVRRSRRTYTSSEPSSCRRQARGRHRRRACQESPRLPRLQIP